MTDAFLKILTQVVTRGQYRLTQMLEKLHVLWVQNLLSDEELELSLIHIFCRSRLRKCPSRTKM